MRKSNWLILFLILCLALISTLQAENNSDKANKQQIQIMNQILSERTQLARNILVKEHPSDWDDFDVTYYRIALELNPNTLDITATTQVGVRVLANTLSQIELDFSIPAITIDGVSKAATSFTISEDSLFLSLNRTYTQDETLQVSVTYHGKPQTPANATVPVFGVFDTGETYPAVYTNNFPNLAHCWFPCRDYPSDKADSTDLLIRVPRGIIAASNGLLRDVINHNDGTATYHWHEGYPISTYVISFAVANYTTVQDIYVTAKGDTIPIINYVFPNDVSKANTAFSYIKPQMEFLEQRWGEYPFLKEKYGNAQWDGTNVWYYWPNQTLGNIHTGALERPVGLVDMYMISLLVRQWWGNWVSPANFGHFWLSDALGAYTGSLWAEHARGPDEYWMWMDYNKDNVIRNKEQTVHRPVGEPIVVSATFDKGSWIFHMLRFEYGDSMFFEVMRDFGQKFAYSKASTEDLQGVWETHTNDDLGWFFHQWIYEPGYPVLSWDWTNFKLSENQYEMRCCINQIQEVGPDVFKMPIILEMQFAAGIERKKFFLDSKDTVFMVQTDKSPLNVLLDPDNAILKEKTQTEKHFKIITWTLEEKSGNGDEGWDPGEIANLKPKIYYEGLDAQSADIRLEPEGEDILPLNAEVSYDNIAEGDTLFSNTQCFEIQAIENAKPRNAKLYLIISRGGIEVQTDSIYVPLGDASILFVDDDGGKDYEQYYEDAFIQNDIFASTWNNKAKGVPSVSAVDYPVIIWSTGAERERTLTHYEQIFIQNYLTNGGAVLIAGQNICYDLLQNGDSKDSLFCSDILHANFVADSGSVHMLMGKATDPLWQGFFVYFQGQFGTSDPISPSVIQPIEPAQSFLSYLGRIQDHAGICYSDPQTKSRLVYLSFGLEAVRGPYKHTAAELVNRCISWLQGMTPANETFHSNQPKKFALHQNYPNPFNNHTVIKFEVPRTAYVTINIYNMLGQRIRKLINKQYSAGYHNIIWNGKNDAEEAMPSGVYFYEMVGQGYSSTRKMLYLK